MTILQKGTILENTYEIPSGGEGDFPDADGAGRKQG